MNETDWLASMFEQNRPHLRKVAYRMLGSPNEADDAIQEAWLRLGRADAGAIQNLGGWLTTVVARVCLDMLRSRKARREDAFPAQLPEAPAEGGDALLAETLAPALLVLLETLTPAERVAFVMHDLFDLPFEEVAAIVGRSEAAARQLASRARRRVRGVEATEHADAARRRELVDAFLAASRDGNFEALLAVLAPDVVFRADALAVRTAAATGWGRGVELATEARGARRIATLFEGKARGARPALVDGEPGAVWIAGGKLRSAFVFTIAGDKIAEIAIVMEPAALAALDVEVRTPAAADR